MRKILSLSFKTLFPKFLLRLYLTHRSRKLTQYIHCHQEGGDKSHSSICTHGYSRTNSQYLLHVKMNNMANRWKYHPWVSDDKAGVAAIIEYLFLFMSPTNPTPILKLHLQVEEEIDLRGKDFDTSLIQATRHCNRC